MLKDERKWRRKKKRKEKSVVFFEFFVVKSMNFDLERLGHQNGVFFYYCFMGPLSLIYLPYCKVGYYCAMDYGIMGSFFSCKRLIFYFFFLFMDKKIETHTFF